MFSGMDAAGGGAREGGRGGERRRLAHATLEGSPQGSPPQEIEWSVIHRERERSLLERAARRVSARGVDECAGVSASDDAVSYDLRLRF